MTEPNRNRAAASEAPPANVSFEEALARVEAIIERIESGEVGLEQSLTEYEQGVALIKRCRQVLEQAQQKVEDLTARMKSGEPDGADEPT